MDTIAAPSRRDGIYESVLDWAKEASTDTLLAWCDAQQFLVVDTSVDPVWRELARERFRALKAELIRRERLHRAQTGVPSVADRRYQDWRGLAKAVRERADMLRVFDLCGYDFQRTGKREAHAACPLCGGRDRLVITAGPPDLCWCRKCEWGGDVVTVAMSFRQCSFRDAVTWLAGLYGEQVAA